MQQILRIWIAVALTLACVGLVQSGEEKDARAIVDKGIQAMGGEAKLTKLQSATFKEKGTYYGMGQGLPFTANYALQFPDKFRMEIEGFFTIVLNGDKGWTKSMDETKEMSKEQLDHQQHDQRAGWINSL